MHKFLTGTAMALMFAAAPALADSTTSASGEVVPSPTVEDKAVSQPADLANGDGGTMIDEGTQATTAGSNAIVGTDEEPAGTFDRTVDEAGATTLEEGKDATTASGEVIPAPDGEGVSTKDPS
jgi:hypothetical protein